MLILFLSTVTRVADLALAASVTAEEMHCLMCHVDPDQPDADCEEWLKTDMCVGGQSTNAQWGDEAEL